MHHSIFTYLSPLRSVLAKLQLTSLGVPCHVGIVYKSDSQAGASESALRAEEQNRRQ